MKQQTVWACLTRAGVLAEDSPTSKWRNNLNNSIALRYIEEEEEYLESFLRTMRWRIAKVRLTIEEVE